MTNKLIWDDCRPDAKQGEHWAASRRGWLFVRVEDPRRMPPGVTFGTYGADMIVYREQLKVWTEPSSVGNYLDYGDDHYRSTHKYCEEGRCDCRLSQPGNIHCVVYSPTGGPARASGYTETIEQAKQWIEEQVRLIRPGLFQEQAA